MPRTIISEGKTSTEAIEKGLKEYDVDLDTGSRRYDLRVTAIK